MKFKPIIYFISGLILLTNMIACRKKSDTAPTITISVTSPLEQAIFANGDTVHINAIINSPVELHGYTWEIRDAAGILLASSQEHSHASTFAINDVWVSNVAKSVQATLLLTVEIDHNGNTSSKTINIECKP